jgi:hypothetical protein
MARPFYEVLSGRVVAVGTTFTGLTMNTGDTLTIRNLKEPELLAAWSFTQADGNLRIFATPMDRYPSLGHDTTQGLRLRHDATRIKPLWDGFGSLGAYMVPGDVLTVNATGSAVALDEETHHLLVYYKADLARFLTPSEVAGRLKRVIGIDTDLAAVATSNYAGEQAIQADFNMLHSDTEYAILGYMSDENYGVIGYREATMTGGRRVGGPGPADTELGGISTKDWFVYLSSKFSRPMIPVFRQADGGNVLVDVTGNENSVTGEITTLLAELSGKTAD